MSEWLEFTPEDMDDLPELDLWEITDPTSYLANQLMTAARQDIDTAQYKGVEEIAESFRQLSEGTTLAGPEHITSLINRIHETLTTLYPLFGTMELGVSRLTGEKVEKGENE